MKKQIISLVLLAAVFGAAQAAELSQIAKDAMLFDAAQKNDVGLALKALNLGASVHAKGLFDAIPLHGAANRNATNVAAMLLAEGANINAADKDDLTPLHSAVKNNAKDVAAMLLEKGANVNAANSDGQTPLHYAAKSNATDVAAMLLAKGANVNAVDCDGQTPLHWAENSNAKDAAAILLEAGAIISDELIRYSEHWLDVVIREINQRRREENEALYAWSNLAGKAFHAKNRANMAVIEKMYQPMLPRASEVYAQRRAAKAAKTL